MFTETGDNIELKIPERRIAPKVIRAWQWTAAISNLFYFILPLGYYFTFSIESTVHLIIFSILLIGSVAIWVLGIVWLPALQWKKWRYSIDKNEIDLLRGIVITRRTLIPLNRVQHVDTRQGPILRHYNLAAVYISTAATTHEIPALDSETADEVRDLISRYARLAEEDV
jgi:uncharacterized protein